MIRQIWSSGIFPAHEGMPFGPAYGDGGKEVGVGAAIDPRRCPEGWAPSLRRRTRCGSRSS